MADDFVLRRQGVTRDFLEKVQTTDGVARKVLLMYKMVRDETRDGNKESKDRMRAKVNAWDFDKERDIQDLDSDTQSEIKAVLRAMQELLKD